MLRIWAAMVVAAATLCGVAHGDMFVIVNGDLESGDPMVYLGDINDAQVNQGWHATGADNSVVLASDAGNTFLRLGSPAEGGFHQAIPTTNVTGPMQLAFDVMVNNSLSDGNPAPGLRVGMWGETNPWNSLRGGSNPGLNQNKANPDILPEVAEDLTGVAYGDLPKIEVDLTQANANTWTTFSYAFDLGPTGFDHSQGGSAGGPVAYLAFGFDNVYEWAGDYLFVDNVRIVPEPMTLALLGLGALASLGRRR